MKRRQFIKQSTSSSAHLAALSAFGLGAGGKAFAAKGKHKIVAEEKWGRLEEITPGVWALISTAFTSKDFSTVCNGGIIAGEKGVLAIEGTMRPKGAQWLKAQAEKLAGRAPTDLVVTHFHGDHVNGHTGYHGKESSPRTWITKSTKVAAEKNFAKAKPVITAFNDVQEINAEETTKIDLGGRSVSLVPRNGHTQSDVTIEISDPKVVWTGDLFFNRVFPNYGDATPNLLNTYASEMDELDDEAIIVPGHGQIADQVAVGIYQEFLTVVEVAATAAHKAGKPAKVSAAEFKLPKGLADWLIWSPSNVEKAFKAWYRLLSS